LQKQADKVQSELMFFYNPLDLQRMANGSVIPALGAITDVSRFLNAVGKEVFVDSEKAYPLKYGMKMFPILNQVNNYMGYFNEDYAKAMGINVSANQNFVK